MKFVFAAILSAVCAVSAGGYTLTDCAGVVRAFGDSASWMSSSFVVGDGSLVLTTWDAVTEKVGPETERLIQYPVFISPYTGRAYQCEVSCYSEDLNLAVLKLPVAGLPAARLAELSEFSKAAYGTFGQLAQGEPVGNSWPTRIYGVARQQKGEGYKLAVDEWTASKVFVTDIGDYKWIFVSGIAPDKNVPNGSILARGELAAGMYLNRLVITGGAKEVAYGRCAMSTEIARYLGDHGISTEVLYEPPNPTALRPEQADTAFQLQALIYSVIGAGLPELALESAQSLVKLLPDDAQSHLVLGQALIGAGKFEEALAAVDRAAKLDAELPTLKTTRALALVGLDRRDEAEAELLAAAKKRPNDVRPAAALAEFYLADEKTLDKALTYARKAVGMDTKSPAALLLLAQVEKRRKNYQAAVDAIGQALKMAPEWGEAWFALGATFEEAGDTENAEKAYKTLVEKQPKNPEALITYASFLVDSKRSDEASELLQKVRDLNPPKAILDAVQKLQDIIDGKTPDTGGENGPDDHPESDTGGEAEGDHPAILLDGGPALM